MAAAGECGPWRAQESFYTSLLLRGSRRVPAVLPVLPDCWAMGKKTGGKKASKGHKRRKSLNSRGLGKPRRKRPKPKPPLTEEEAAALREAARSEPPKPGQYNPFGLTTNGGTELVWRVVQTSARAGDVAIEPNLGKCLGMCWACATLTGVHATQSGRARAARARARLVSSS